MILGMALVAIRLRGALSYIFALRVPLLCGVRFLRAEADSVGNVIGKVSRIYVASISQ